ncbi:MAG: fibrobacter succinogenes major paralogous domain-containing protein [Bacteroidales bacterium]|jgi:uncharacterized protein (TIGR02145 family)|nr:fibrobacter succinogenes major paralogous domain-containing protein [Bacteroidales bacterium]
MKKPTILLPLLLLALSTIYAQAPKKDRVIDIDGNVYQTVIIGNYEWMANNLRTTTYNDGTKIPKVSDSITWSGLSSDAYCWYNNDESNADAYGALYNWYAVNTAKLCPDGWRVPSDNEWKFLEGSVDIQYGIGDAVWDDIGLRGNDVGQRLKSKSGWRSGSNGSDEFGFSALPCGERLISGRYFIAGSNGFWWSNTGYSESRAWYRSLIYAFEDIFRLGHDKRFGFSVRCLRDKQIN